MINAWIENIVLKRMCVMVAAEIGSYFARHAFGVAIDSPKLAETLDLAAITVISSVHHYFARKYPTTVGKWL